MRVLQIIVALFLSLGFSSAVFSQSWKPVNGVQTPDHTIYAFTHAHIVASSDQTFENGTLLIQDGKILGCGSSVSVPPNAVVYDLNGKYIYPSFIELYSNYGMPAVEKKNPSSKNEFVSKKAGNFYWNEAIHPEVKAVSTFSPNKKEAANYQKNGFGIALTHQFNGIARGAGAVVAVNDAEEAHIIKEIGGSYYSFGKGNSNQLYPSSLMGSFALVRQTILDMQWYGLGMSETPNQSLQAMLDYQELPSFFYGNSYKNVLRVGRIQEEFEMPFTVVSGGDDYKRIDEIKKANVSLVVPLNFPAAYDVTDPLDAKYISLAAMKHWELAPTNPKVVYENEIPFALTGSKNPKKFWENLRKSVVYGLPANEALRALTETPAKMLNLDSELGSLEAGKQANFFISNTDVFEGRGKIMEQWTGAHRTIFSNVMAVNPEGLYNLNVGAVLYTMEIRKSSKGYTVKSTLGGSDSEQQTGQVSLENDLLTIIFPNGTNKTPGPVRMVGKVNYKGKIIDGKVQDGKGNWSNWTAIKQKEKSASNTSKERSIANLELGDVFYPNMAYGDTTLPQQESYFIKNVVIWTCDSIGKFKGNILISNGKIEAVGERIPNPNNYTTIEGEGMHLTPGLIDEHSHIAVSNSVNESGQNNSAEVRIGDVLNPEDVNIYRQLAGGVTTAQLLHGSANPIGGQSQIIKLRWGVGPEQMKYENAPQFIKFALGENVKQSNWGNQKTTRFPQTRMGVEQVYMDAFTRAKQYRENWMSYNGQSKRDRRKNPIAQPRRDLELEAIMEILDTNRYITCHSYIQSEITMLMNVGDTMGFRVNTFTHILEGYKVADKLANHGAYASTFSDWWAYKFEVNDAIPYNAAILTENGVVTAINSDDAEMGRRLNQEAAKTVKYGGVSEVEAMKMVTINPAMMLHIDDKVGSILPGKTADLVLWNGHPLAVSTSTNMVFIDGCVYYSAENNARLMEVIQSERQRLILKMLAAKKRGEETQKVTHHVPKIFHCDTE